MFTACAADPLVKPNLIVISPDDLGCADGGFKGCKDIPTPNIDRVAKEGVRCTNGHVTHPFCDALCNELGRSAPKTFWLVGNNSGVSCVYYPVASVLESHARFWRAFFAELAPNPSVSDHSARKQITQLIQAALFEKIGTMTSLRPSNTCEPKGIGPV